MLLHRMIWHLNMVILKKVPRVFLLMCILFKKDVHFHLLNTVSHHPLIIDKLTLDIHMKYGNMHGLTVQMGRSYGFSEYTAIPYSMDVIQKWIHTNLYLIPCVKHETGCKRRSFFLISNTASININEGSRRKIYLFIE